MPPLPDWIQSYAQQYIDGEWRQGSGDWDVIVFNPYDGEKLAAITVATATEVDLAYRSAAAAQRAWADTSPYDRRRVFERAAGLMAEREPEIIATMTAELGATAARAAYELDQCRSFLREAMQLPLRSEGRILASLVPGKENYLTREPVGTVCVIAPFNFPVFSALKPLAAALALGNAVVLKPHQATPLCGGVLLARLLEQAGLPPGLLNLVITDIAEVGDALIEHPVPQVISFSGSKSTGRHVASTAGSHLKRAIVERGSNSALLVLSDADVDYAVDAALFSRFLDQGQVTMSASRIVLDEAVKAEFTDKFVARVAALRVGDPADPATQIGPLISPRVVEELTRDIERTVAAGGRLLTGGQARGNVLHPAVLDAVPPGAPLYHREIFGPVVLLTEVAGDEAAARAVHDAPHVLTGAVHTQDVQRGLRLAQRLRTGVVHVNDATVSSESTVPFGGECGSGVGRLNGEALVDALTRTTWISVQQGRSNFPF